MKPIPLTAGVPALVAVMTSFNRKAMTLECLRALEISARSANVDLRAILVDDASSDGTASAVLEAFSWAEVIAGSGSLFWNRGMRLGFGLALRRRADYYLWINDDTVLFEDAVGRLIGQSRDLEQRSRKPAILVGATADRESGQLTYGGSVARSRLRRFTYRSVWDEVQPMRCDAMNGNCVLIPQSIAQSIGNLDPVYEHAMGDTDYALRARRAGYEVFVAGGIVGHCSNNPSVGTFTDNSLPWRRRWHLILSRKGLPLRSWLHFTRTHGGMLWPLYFTWPYARLVLSGVRLSRPKVRPTTSFDPLP